MAMMGLDAYLAHLATEQNADSLWCRGSMIPLMLVTISLLGVRELGSMLRKSGLNPHLPLAALACTALMLAPWMAAGGLLGDRPTDVEAMHGQAVWLTLALMVATLAHMFRGASPTAAADIASSWLIIIYLGFLPSFAVHLRTDYNLADPVRGAWNLLIVLLIAFAADVGALFAGLRWGRHKLAPTISPGKTVEGAVGGVLASVLVGISFKLVAWLDVGGGAGVGSWPQIWSESVNEFTSTFHELSTWQIILLCVFISVAAQAGDLFESLLKRGAQLKDSSRLVPGMGGVLDVVDGAIFACPVAWFALTRLLGTL